MLQEIYNQYKELGIYAVPFQWNTEANEPLYQKEGWNIVGNVFQILPNDNALEIFTGNGWGA